MKVISSNLLGCHMIIKFIKSMLTKRLLEIIYIFTTTLAKNEYDFKWNHSITYIIRYL